MPMMATTIISSIRVKPFCMDCFMKNSLVEKWMQTLHANHRSFRANLPLASNGGFSMK
jgi:nitrate/TMAO reductase-like tetraheme cytochrome c subunit